MSELNYEQNYNIKIKNIIYPSGPGLCKIQKSGKGTKKGIKMP